MVRGQRSEVKDIKTFFKISSLVHLFMVFIFVVAHQSKWSARNIADGHFSSGVCKVGFHCTTYVRILNTFLGGFIPKAQPMSNSRKCMWPNGKTLQLHAVQKKLQFLPQSHARIRICIASHMKTCTCATSHVRICIRYCKSHILQFFRCSSGCNDFIIWTFDFITCSDRTRLLPSVLLLVLHTCNNTDGNKHVIQLFTVVVIT